MRRGIASCGLLVCACLVSAAALAAGERNDIPSCYDAAKMSEARPAGTGRELIVVIDETLQLPKELQESAYQHVLRFVQPGDSVRLYQFSAYLAGRYFSMPFAGQLERPLTGKTRDSIAMNLLKQLDTCLTQQQGFFRKTFGQQMLKSFGSASTDIARSEIFSALKQIGNDAGGHEAGERVLLLVSDMLENSDFGSFYSNNRIRDIKPEDELGKVEKQALFADLRGARVFVLGAGLVPHEVKHGYRSGKTMQALEAFWREYFARSNASLEAFGAPSLTTDLH